MTCSYGRRLCDTQGWDVLLLVLERHQTSTWFSRYYVEIFDYGFSIDIQVCRDCWREELLNALNKNEGPGPALRKALANGGHG